MRKNISNSLNTQLIQKLFFLSYHAMTLEQVSWPWPGKFSTNITIRLTETHQYVSLYVKTDINCTCPFSVWCMRLTLTGVLLAWTLWDCPPVGPGSLWPPPVPCARTPATAEPLVQVTCMLPVLLGLCLIPSSSRTRRMLLGNSSTPLSTSVRHSGQRSSPRDPTIPSRQRRQNVCWHGNTFAVASSRSKHTGHSNRSRSADSSIFTLAQSFSA